MRIFSNISPHKATSLTLSISKQELKIIFWKCLCDDFVTSKEKRNDLIL
nr:MAG TPA: hypothetical protein [Caudoviricetes sp.]